MQVRVGMMDSRRPESVVIVPARRLRFFERLWRATGRFFGITGTGLVVGNMLLLMLPFPHLHLCLFPVALVLGPLIAFVTWRDRVLLAPALIPCPHCHHGAMVPAQLAGWPARFNCEHCGIRVELKPAA
jgi:hypothetical protein